MMSGTQVESAGEVMRYRYLPTTLTATSWRYNAVWGDGRREAAGGTGGSHRRGRGARWRRQRSGSSSGGRGHCGGAAKGHACLAAAQPSPRARTMTGIQLPSKCRWMVAPSRSLPTAADPTDTKLRRLVAGTTRRLSLPPLSSWYMGERGAPSCAMVGGWVGG